MVVRFKFFFDLVFLFLEVLFQNGGRNRKWKSIAKVDVKHTSKN